VRHRSLDQLSDDDNGEAGLAMRAIAVLDPLAPLCWRGVALWPDGIGTALAVAQGSDPDVVLRLEEIVIREEAGNWAVQRPDRCDFTVVRVEARQQHSWLRQRSPGGVPRLAYLLNPLMPCASPLMGGQWVARLPELLPALEATAAQADRQKTEPVDIEMAAFISARLERRMEQELAAQVGGENPSATCLAQLRVLAQLQSQFHPRPLPALAAWLGSRVGPVLATWRNRERRAGLEEQLQVLTQGGYLALMLQALDDPAGRTADAREASEAVLELARTDFELAQIASGGPGRTATAARLGQEIAVGLGLTALAIALVVAALG
jgi:hypothetical protein